METPHGARMADARAAASARQGHQRLIWFVTTRTNRFRIVAWTILLLLPVLLISLFSDR